MSLSEKRSVWMRCLEFFSKKKKSRKRRTEIFQQILTNNQEELTRLVQKANGSFDDRLLKIVPKKRKMVIDSTFLQVEEQKVQELFNPTFQADSGEISDLFRMKAISLLRENKIPLALDKIKEAPILFEERESFVLLKQKYVPFPGETVIITGKLKKDPNSERHVAVPKSFSLSSTSSQGGYPHAAQHTGFGVPKELIMPYLDLLEGSLLYQLFEKKDRLLQEFPRKMAARIVDQRRLEFESDVKKSCKFFSTLIEALLGEKDIRVEKFLQYVERQKSPYLVLAKAHEEINTLPTWKELAKSGFKLKMRGGLDPIVRDYQRAVHTKLFPAYCEIIKQSLSILSDSEQKQLSTLAGRLQSSAYMHLESFLNDLEEEKVTPWHELMQRDLNLFQGKIEPLPYSGELKEA